MAKMNKRAAEILRAASDLFADKGYEGASIRNLAAAVGVSIPTIYLYFGSKRNLYDEVCAHIFSEHRAAHAANLDLEGDDRTRLYRYILSIATDLMSDDRYLKFAHREMLEQNASGLKKFSRRAFHDAVSRAGEICDRLSPERKDGYVRIYVAVTLIFGLVSTLRAGKYLHPGLNKMYNAKNMTKHVLEQMFPEVNWSGVDRKKH